MHACMHAWRDGALLPYRFGSFDRPDGRILNAFSSNRYCSTTCMMSSAASAPPPRRLAGSLMPPISSANRWMRAEKDATGNGTVECDAAPTACCKRCSHCTAAGTSGAHTYGIVLRGNQKRCVCELYASFTLLYVHSKGASCVVGVFFRHVHSATATQYARGLHRLSTPPVCSCGCAHEHDVYGCFAFSPSVAGVALVVQKMFVILCGGLRAQLLVPARWWGVLATGAPC
jgi:hypothetical protein